MCASVKHQQGKQHVVLLPHQQPIRLDVALPCTVALEARQLVRLVLARQGTFFAENVNQICNLVHIQPTLGAPLDGAFELRCVVNRVHRSIC